MLPCTLCQTARINEVSADRCRPEFSTWCWALTVVNSSRVGFIHLAAGPECSSLRSSAYGRSPSVPEAWSLAETGCSLVQFSLSWCALSMSLLSVGELLVVVEMASHFALEVGKDMHSHQTCWNNDAGPWYACIVGEHHDPARCRVNHVRVGRTQNDGRPGARDGRGRRIARLFHGLGARVIS